MEKDKSLVSIHLRKKGSWDKKAFQIAHFKAFVDFNGPWIRLLIRIPARLVLNLGL